MIPTRNDIAGSGRIGRAGLWLAAALLIAGTAHAQPYPNKPITLIAPYAAGGDSDLSGRNLAATAAKLMGQPLVVHNIVGASGTIGSMRVRTATPDGYTLLIARGGSQAITPALESKTPYKWNDFTMLSLLEFNPVVCVVKSDAPTKSLKELLDTLKASPGKLNYATAGPGTTQHMAAEVLMRSAGLPSTSAVGIGYKSGAEVTTATLGGQVQFLCNNLPTVGAHIKAGTLRALFVTTAERLKEYPDIPTAREMGHPDMEQVMGWSGLYGPPDLPAEVVNKWGEVLKRLAQDPDWLRGNAGFGGVPAIRSMADTEKFARGQFEMYERLGTALGLRK